MRRPPLYLFVAVRAGWERDEAGGGGAGALLGFSRTQLAHEFLVAQRGHGTCFQFLVTLFCEAKRFVLSFTNEVGILQTGPQRFRQRGPIMRGKLQGGGSDLGVTHDWP